MTNQPTLRSDENGLPQSQAALSAPLVNIITLNYKQPAYTIDCLRSLSQLTYPNYKVLVLDNGSGDDSVSKITAYLPELTYPVEFIDNKANLGFADGNNVGIKRALADGAAYVLLLNNDTEVAPDFIEPLVERMEADPRIGITGSKIYYYADPKRIWSAGGVFDQSGSTKQLGVNELDTPELNTARQVDYVTGCAMLVSRALIEKAGMFDGRFFMYYEETDWCARAAQAGYQVWYIPQSFLWHKIELTARDASAFYIYLMTRNRLLFLRNLGQPAWRVMLSLVTLDLRTVLAWSVWKRYEKVRHLRRARWLGMRDFLRGHFGPPPAKLRTP